MARQNQSLLEWLNRYPPFLCYALARNRHAPPNGKNRRPHFDELVKSSGLSRRTFGRIAVSLTWENMKIRQIEAFLRACDVNLLHMRPHLHYLRRGALKERPLFGHLNTQLKHNLEQRFQRWVLLSQNGRD